MILRRWQIRALERIVRYVILSLFEFSQYNTYYYKCGLYARKSIQIAAQRDLFLIVHILSGIFERCLWSSLNRGIIILQADSLFIYPIIYSFYCTGSRN